MGLIRRSGTKGSVWYVRIKVRGRQVWKSLHTHRKPSPREAAAEEAKLWGEAGYAPPGEPAREKTEASAAVAEFCAWIAANRAPSYSRRISWCLAEASRSIGTASLAGWTRDKIEAFIKEGREGKGWAKGRRAWSPRTGNIHLSMIGRFLGWAVKRDKIVTNPVRDMERAREIQRQPMYLTADQVGKVVAEAAKADARRKESGDPAWVEAAVRIALGTGARVSELLALTWADVDRQGGQVRLIPGKGKRGRSVPIGPMTEAGLGLLGAHGKTERLFPDTRQDSHVIRRVLKKAGVAAGWHVFRHTCASHLVAAGVPLPVVREILGHRDISTTMRYAHNAPGASRDALRRLDFGQGQELEGVAREGYQKS